MLECTFRRSGPFDGSLSRETIGGRWANVLRGRVSMENNGGFIQMATDLSLDPSVNMFVMHQRTMGSSWMFTAREQQMLTKVSTFTY